MEKANLFEGNGLICANCSKDLFENPELSIAVILRNKNGDFMDVYTCCKGECDKKLLLTRRKKDYTDGWQDITDFMNPVLYLKQTMTFINKLQDGTKFTEEAFEQYKNILLQCSPYVMRNPSKTEEQKVENWLSMPWV